MKLSTVLLKQAEQIRSGSAELTALGILKKAGIDDTQARIEVAQRMMEKEATSHLVASGIDYDAALQMVKVANVRVANLKEFKIEPTSDEVLIAELEKAASVAEQLEAQIADRDALLEKIAELEDQLENASTTQQVPDSLTKFAQSGAFTNEDLQALKALPTDTLTKIASAQERPWTMGGGAGQDVDALDPIAQFCLS